MSLVFLCYLFIYLISGKKLFSFRQPRAVDDEGLSPDLLEFWKDRGISGECFQPELSAQALVYKITNLLQLLLLSPNDLDQVLEPINKACNKSELRKSLKKQLQALFDLDLFYEEGPILHEVSLGKEFEEEVSDLDDYEPERIKDLVFHLKKRNDELQARVVELTAGVGGFFAIQNGNVEKELWVIIISFFLRTLFFLLIHVLFFTKVNDCKKELEENINSFVRTSLCDSGLSVCMNETDVKAMLEGKIEVLNRARGNEAKKKCTVPLLEAEVAALEILLIDINALKEAHLIRMNRYERILAPLFQSGAAKDVAELKLRLEETKNEAERQKEAGNYWTARRLTLHLQWLEEIYQQTFLLHDYYEEEKEEVRNHAS